MEIERPDATVAPAIRDVVTRSMRASYSVSPETIDALGGEFDEDSLTARLDDGERELLVASIDDEPVGFVEGRAAPTDRVTVHWLHVAPRARGQGVATELVSRLHERVRDGGDTTLRMRVLGTNREGASFVERLGLSLVGEDTIEVAGTRHAVEVYAEDDAPEDDTPERRAAEVASPDLSDLPEEVETDEGPLPVGQEGFTSGTDGPFLSVYWDADTEDLAGYHCTNCGSLVQTVDSLGRIECGTCGNHHRPDEWDGSYL